LNTFGLGVDEVSVLGFFGVEDKRRLFRNVGNRIFSDSAHIQKYWHNK